jgi:hypothetical protein
MRMQQPPRLSSVGDYAEALRGHIRTDMPQSDMVRLAQLGTQIPQMRLRRFAITSDMVTGLRLNEFADLLDDLLPRLATAEQTRLRRSNRRRAPGGGRHADLAPRDQILLAVIWLRQYPTNEVLGFLFGVSDSTASRVLSHVIPLLEAAGRDTIRMPDPGRKRRKELDVLLKETPELAVIIDSFEQRMQRPRERQAADCYHRCASMCPNTRAFGGVSCWLSGCPGA